MNKQKLIELRCKAWGITEDEYYCNQCSDFSLEDMARAYRRGKNKGARDKAIQNVGFYQKQMQDIYDKKNKQIAKLETQIEKMKKYGKLLRDICDVMGNDPYMVWRGLEQRVLILWDKSEEEKGLKMADDILERLLKISAIDLAEIEKWDIKEND